VLNNWSEEEYDKLWQQLCDDNTIMRNDSYGRYMVSDATEADKILNSSRAEIDLDNHLKSLGFEEAEEVLFWVSW
jgi:hypothetical protein